MIYDVDMIRAHYETYGVRVKVARAAMARPLTLAEKILFAHLFEPADCLESGGKGRGQAVTVMGLWHEEDGGGALHLAGVAGERASHTGARCRRLLRLSGGLRTQASQRQKRGARRGPDLVRDGWARRTAPETKVTTHQEQMSSLGCDMAAGTWWDGEWWLAARVAEISRGPRRARM